jgi:hypothetical protein
MRSKGNFTVISCFKPLFKQEAAEVHNRGPYVDAQELAKTKSASFDSPNNL